MSEHERNDDLLPDDPPPRHRDEDFEDHDPLEAEPPPPSAEPVVVPRWIQLVALPLLLLLGFAIIKAAGTVVLLFVTAAVIALILNPLVAGLQRFHLPRGVAIVCVYLGFVAALAAAGVLLANPISDQVTALRDDIPSITDSANQRLADVQDYFDRKGINVEIKKQGHTALDTLQSKVVGGTDSIVSFGHRPADEDRHRQLRADPRLRPLGLHAHPRRANRRARARGDAARERHARGRLPRRGWCGRSRATCAASCCSAW